MISFNSLSLPGQNFQDAPQALTSAASYAPLAESSSDLDIDPAKDHQATRGIGQRSFLAQQSFQNQSSPPSQERSNITPDLNTRTEGDSASVVLLANAMRRFANDGVFPVSIANIPKFSTLDLSASHVRDDQSSSGR
jgi:hypothetical protein